MDPFVTLLYKLIDFITIIITLRCPSAVIPAYMFTFLIRDGGDDDGDDDDERASHTDAVIAGSLFDQ